MKTVILVLTMCLVIMTQVVIADECPPPNNPSCEPYDGEGGCLCECGNYGDPLGSYLGLTSLSSGEWVGSGCSDYQCVTFVKDFYTQVVNDPIVTSWGTAKNAYSLADGGAGDNNNLLKYPQGGTVKPAPGDIHCFGEVDPVEHPNSGHAAIITEVGSDYIKIIDQNRTNLSSNVILPLSLSSSAPYNVGTIGQYYSVQGWLRDPDYTPPSFGATLSEQFPTDPSGVLYLQVDETIDCGFKVYNSGGLPLSNDGGSEYYIELRSVNSDYDANQTSNMQGTNWIDGIRITTSNTTAPSGEYTWYYFNIVTPIEPGFHTLYLRLFNPHTTAFIGETGWTIKIHVAAPSPPFHAPDGIIAREIENDALMWRVAKSNVDDEFDNSRIVLSSFGKKYHKHLWGDVNGDGYDDLMSIQTVTGGYNRIKVALSDGVGGMYIDRVWIANFGESGDEYLVGDFNGDGNCDIAHSHTYPSTNVGWSIALSNGTDAFVDDGEWVDHFGNTGDQWYVGYFTNDNKCDFAFRREVSGTDQVIWKVKPTNSTGTGFEATAVWLSDFGSPGQLSFVGDFTGDGKDDIARNTWKTNGDVSFHVARSDGDEFTPLGTWCENFGQSGDEWFAKEMNGDSRCDIVQVREIPSTNNVRWKVNFSVKEVGVNYFKNSMLLDSDFGNPGDKYFVGEVVPTSYGSAKIQTEPDQSLPISFQLRQNYPNPFNPVTTVSYDLPTACHVELSVFNILGHKVETLINEHQAAGEHSATWNANRRASGVYFYRLKAGDATETKKMVLLK